MSLPDSRVNKKFAFRYSFVADWSLFPDSRAMGAFKGGNSLPAPL